MSAKTIQILLPDGDPLGLQVASIAGSMLQAVAFPRVKKHLKSALEHKAAARGAAFYFLFGKPSPAGKPMVYIGETTAVRSRIELHNQQRPNWEEAVIFTSRTDDFTATHGKYLEWLAIKTAREAKRYELDQRDQNEPHITEHMEQEIQTAFDEARILLVTLGFPLFEPLPSATIEPQEFHSSHVTPPVTIPEQQPDLGLSAPKDLETVNQAPCAVVSEFICKGPDADAIGRPVDRSFLVFKGSRARKNHQPAEPKNVDVLRKELIKQGILREQGDQLVFTKDYLFDGPKIASQMVLARSANGWTEWKTKDGKVLSAFKKPDDSETER